MLRFSQIVLYLMITIYLVMPSAHAANYTVSYQSSRDVNGYCTNMDGTMIITPSVPSGSPADIVASGAISGVALRCTTDANSYMNFFNSNTDSFKFGSYCDYTSPYNLVKSVTLYNSSGSNISVSYEAPSGTVLGSFSAAPGTNDYSLGSGVSAQELFLTFSTTSQLQVVSWGLDTICGVQNISFTPPASGTYGGSTTLSASATSGLPVTFTSATPGICTVSGTNGTTINYDGGAGTCTINANQAGDASYRAAPQVSVNVTVSKANQTITSFPAPSNLFVGQTATLTATADSGLTIFVFGSNTPTICTVSGSTVSYLAAGTCSLTADQTGNTNYNAADPKFFNVIVLVCF